LLLDDNNNDSQACMLTFYPRFETLTNSNEQVEIIFIVDVSNSMDGNHVQQAKQLTHLFLTNLKIGDGNTYFNIITFGSDNDECFPISTLTTKENLDKAKHFVLVREVDFSIEMYIFIYSSIHLFIVVIRIYLLSFIVIHYYHRHYHRNLVVNSLLYPMDMFMI